MPSWFRAALGWAFGMRRVNRGAKKDRPGAAGTTRAPCNPRHDPTPLDRR